MEVRVRERLIGALVLVAIVVLVVPAILKGRDPAPAASAGIRADAAGRSADRQCGARARGADPGAGARTIRFGAGRRRRAHPARPASRNAKAAAKRNALRRRAEARTRACARSACPRRLGRRRRGPSSSARSRTARKAEQLVAELRKRRYAAFVLEYRASGQVLYRVRVGPEQDRERAEEIAARLAKDGFQPVVARHP